MRCQQLRYLPLLFLILVACGKEHEKVTQTFDSGAPRTALLVLDNGDTIGLRTWHGNGIIATETEWQAGKPHGSYKRFGTNGVLFEQGQFEEGRRSGEWITWYGRGKTESRGSFDQGLAEGAWEGYHPDGSLAWEHFFQAGKPVGLWRKFHANGTLAEENSCHSSSAKGFIRRFSNKSRQLSYQECQWGLAHGLWVENYESGTPRLIGRYHKGKMDSIWTLYRADGGLWKYESWKRGLRNGLWFWLGRSLDTLVVTHFDSGNGTFGSPCPSGGLLPSTVQCAETTWVGGLVQSTRQYTENHKYLRIEVWDNGQKRLSSDWRTDSLGNPTQLAAEGHWLDGKRDGVWRNWYSNGQLKDSLHYRTGEFYGEQFNFDMD